MDTVIRVFTTDDFDFALAQTTREGWDATADLFQLCLAHDPDGGFIAEADGRPIGLVTTIRYRATAWIGHLVVEPACRRRGIGEHLMAHALAHLAAQGIRTIRLEADPAGIRLYRRLGFVDEWESPRFHLTRSCAPRPGNVARMTQADLALVGPFDAERFGDDRGRLLALLFQQANAAYWVRDGGQVRGYALVARRGGSQPGVRIGPCVAVDREAAEMLLHAILRDWGRAPIVLGVPGVNGAALALLTGSGFEQRTSCLRMVHGDRVAVGRPEHVYAISDGALG
jgi:ribosomal protein S18 acetylase RimI-like enzyme